MAFQLVSSILRSNGVIPKEHTCDGADTSIPIAWQDPPEGTKSFALIADDPDAPSGTWVHWVLYDLPPGTRELPSGIGLKNPCEMARDKERTTLEGLAMAVPVHLPVPPITTISNYTHWTK